MKQMRLTRLQVGIAGLAVMVGLAALFLLAFIRPLKAQIKTTNENAQTQDSYARTNGPKAEKDLAQAKQREAVVMARFDSIMENRMPSVNLTDPIAGMFRLWRLPREEGVLIDNWFRSSGAVVSGYSFPAFPSTPADSSIKVLPAQSWGLSVQVRDFPQLLEWLQKIPKAPRFMVMQSVNIQGPRQPGQPLMASVPVVLYEWTAEAEKAVKAQASAPAAAGAAAPGAPAAPGGAGMRGGGMRGGGMRGGGMRGGGMRGGR